MKNNPKLRLHANPFPQAMLCPKSSFLSVSIAALKGILFASAVGFASGVSAGPLLWVDDVNGYLGTVDVATGGVHVIGYMGTVMTDIAFDPTGKLYGINGSNLYQINSATAATTFIGSLGYSASSYDHYATMNALAFDKQGHLFSAAYGLYSVDVTTGAASKLGPYSNTTYYTTSGDLAFVGNNLYNLYLSGWASSGSSDYDQLFALNPANGQGYPAGYPYSSGYIHAGSTYYNHVYGLATDDNVHLYGLSRTTVLSIDPSSGVATTLVNYAGHGLVDAYGSAFYSEAGAVFAPPNHVPESGNTSAMMLAGLGVLGFMARRWKETGCSQEGQSASC